MSLSATDYPAKMLAVDFGGTAKVKFDMNGQPNTAGSVTVESGGYQKIVNLDAVTGHAVVQ